jgi:BatD DUF11 like domain
VKRGSMGLAVWVAVASLLICTAANATDVRAWLDRNSMQMGETVTLNVEVSGDNGAAKPDFTPLAQEFNLLGTQSSTSMNIINGQASSKMLWAIGLEPKHAGTLAIPALDVAGQHTQALSLSVQAATAGTGGKTGDDVYIEAAIEPHAPYVQQQVHLTVKLYFAVNLSDGSLDEPQADGLVVRKLGQDANYAADVAGRRYRVLERHYALLPEKSGGVSLPPIGFRGHAVDPGDINSFFSRGRSVAARSEAITLDVRPRPPASGSDAWLPARSTTLTADGIDAATTAKVGEPLTLTLHLKAQGLGFEQLPELKVPLIEGADVYPDKTTTQNRDDGEWLYGERERKFAIVPNRAGPLTLPAISIDWWDTAHDRAETAQVPARTLDVQAGVVSATKPDAARAPTAAASTNAQNTELPGTATAGDVAFADQGAQAELWRRLALFALTLWTLTLAAWIYWLLAQRRRERAALPAAPIHAAPIHVGSLAARSAFHEACRRADWPSAARALLGWARVTQPRLRNLGELALALEDSAQIAVLGELERVCYGRGAASGLENRLIDAFGKGPDFTAAMAQPAGSQHLPALYPFRIQPR